MSTPVLLRIRLFFERRLRALLLEWRVYYIGGPETLPPPLAGEEEARVFAALRADTPDRVEWARQQLITHNLRLVVYIARKFDSTGVGVDDLTSIGTIGLIKAVNTFAPERGIKLATYASRCIENEILMFLRKIAPLRGEVSLDEPLHIDWDGNELLLSDILGGDDDDVHRRLENDCERDLLLSAVDRLPAREREIMRLRFGLSGGAPMTQKEVADRVGISQSYISRLEKRIIRRLGNDLAGAF